MDDNFIEEMKHKSNEELKDIVINFQMYRGAMISAAKIELANRGIELSDDENQIIEKTKDKRKQEVMKNQETKKSWDSFNVKWKQNIVTDIAAPQLYSRQVLNVFSILFSVLFGGILLIINLKTVKNKKGILPVLIYSIGYTGLMIYILNLIPGKNSGLTLIFNLIGAIVLYNFFWGKYIGKDFQYRTKPFWIPLIIGGLIIAFFIWIMIIGNQI